MMRGFKEVVYIEKGQVERQVKDIWKDERM